MYRRDAKPKDHWLVRLELSTKWKFQNMKKLVVALLLPVYKLLCKCTNRMSKEEGEQLKMPTVLWLHEVRERAIRSAAESGCRSPTSADAEDRVLEQILNEVFDLNGLVSTVANNSQNGVSRVHHHPEYYLRDGNITFLVENTLFRVHRYFFERESQFFIHEFVRAPQEGTSDTSAFRLDSITSADFAKLLWVWYNQRDAKPKDHWLVILELSTKWKFPDMKKLAVDELQKLEIDPVEKIVTYDKYEVDRSLLLPAFKLLCKRTNRMSNEECEQLKMPTVLGLYEVRERAIRSAAESGRRNPTPADAEDGVLEQLLNEVFSLNGHTRRRGKVNRPQCLSSIPRGQMRTGPQIGHPRQAPQNGRGQGGAGGSGATGRNK